MKPCSSCTSPISCKRDGICYQHRQRVLEGELLAPAKDLDPEKLALLAERLYHVVQDHYMTSGIGNITVLEALNALAVVAGTIIKGTNLDAKPFFLEALDLQLKVD